MSDPRSSFAERSRAMDALMPAPMPHDFAPSITLQGKHKGLELNAQAAYRPDGSIDVEKLARQAETIRFALWQSAEHVRLGDVPPPVEGEAA